MQDLFRFLEDKEYILLKFPEMQLSRIDEHSDLDILIRKNISKKIIAFFSHYKDLLFLSKESRLSMVQCFLHFRDGSFLQIDLLKELHRKEWLYLDNKYLFSKKIKINGIYTYTKFCLLEHLVFFNYLNYSGIPQKYVDYFNQLPASLKDNLIENWNNKYKTNTIIRNFNDLLEFDSDLRIELLQYLSNKKYNNSINIASRKFRYLLDTFKSIIMRRGNIISFTGVDGAGKSTIIEETKNILEKKYRKKVKVLRHRPSMLPIISAWRYGKEAAEKKAAETLPRQGNNKSGLSSALRFTYYYLDFLFGRFQIFFKYQLRDYVILYDRYYFDFIVDGKRSNMNINSKLTSALYRFVQKPDMNFFLYAKPEVILSRKKELKAEDIEQLTGDYKKLFKDFGAAYNQEYIPIENIDKEETLSIISSKLKLIL